MIGANKRSYTIPCSSRFRDRVRALAERRRVNVGDLARSVLLVVPAGRINAFPDPGDPDRDDRETVILKSGPAAGRPWRRKPRLQVRMAAGYDVGMMRKALGLALVLGDGSLSVKLTPVTETEPTAPVPDDAPESPQSRNTEELMRLRTIISILSFDPIADGVKTRDEALFVLGLPPGGVPEKSVLRARFRMLATIHHPDSATGDHERMSQLNTAMDVLRHHA